MPIFIGDYLADTGHLTTTQHGAYLLLMMHYWRKLELPDDDKQLAAIAKLPLRIWLDSKETIQSFFHDGWKHKRIESELQKRLDVSNKRAEAGAKGGKSRAEPEAIATDLLKQNASMSHTHKQKEDSEAKASGADAPDDPRKRLFNEGLPKLRAMTGKGPDACRSFVGKCLKAAGDDALVVLGLIEDAERNQVIDPSGWIVARLKAKPEFANAAAKSDNSLLAAIDRNLHQSIAQDADFEASAHPILFLSH